jgi:transposase-like protein
MPLDEDMLAGIKTARERKLSNAERLAIFAFAKRGVPVKILARTFSVTPNAIRYITNYQHTAAHEHAKQMFEQYGEERVWSEVVTEAQTESINEGMRRTFEGKDLNDRGHRRNARRSPRARRARTTSELPETANDGADGGDRAA